MQTASMFTVNDFYFDLHTGMQSKHKRNFSMIKFTKKILYSDILSIYTFLKPNKNKFQCAILIKKV